MIKEGSRNPLTWQDANRRQQVRNFLDKPTQGDRLVDVVRAVCGVQAQILSAAEIAIGVRVAGITRDDVQKAIWEKRQLVKTYGPRGTLHLLPADELPLWMAALRAVQNLRSSVWYEDPGPPSDAPGLKEGATGPLAREQGEALLEAVGKALDGQCLTREELAEEVGQLVGEWAVESTGSLPESGSGANMVSASI